MSDHAKNEADAFLDRIRERTPGETEFHQAVGEVVRSVMPVVLDTQSYRDAGVLDRVAEPDRVVSFRVAWTDDSGVVNVNRGYRVQFNGVLGPYKGGLRFRPTVNQSILKFLGFEQTFKNALTGLPMGGGKGGSDFDPKGKSDREVERFCQAFMTELLRHIGDQRDVPAGDIGVGGREIGYLFGQHRRVTGEWTGVLTGKGAGWGGSLMRTEATGYGLVYLVKHAVEHAGGNIDGGIEGKRVAISGSGNVALHAAEKVLDFGGVVVSLSDSGGTVRVPGGIDSEQLAEVKRLKLEQRGRISSFAEKYGHEYQDGARPWGIEADVALPCATQNEIEAECAGELVKAGVKLVAEGANMPTTADAIERLHEGGVTVLPGKAANAGGVSVSGLEMSQNASHAHWDARVVDEKLKDIMGDIHERCVEHGQAEDGLINYVLGANVAGFVKVADAMVAQGVM
ncbi:MAG: NADP-specific glutamate dehydrogenase [Planctomycetota bacterium]